MGEVDEIGEPVDGLRIDGTGVPRPAATWARLTVTVGGGCQGVEYEGEAAL